MAYAVVRTDLMSGTDVGAGLVSCRVVNSTPEAIAVENGVLVVVGALETGEREVHAATLATSSTTLAGASVALVANPEVMYDEHKKNLDEYINEAGKVVRAYRLHSHDIFSVTAEGFESTSAVPAKGDTVGFGANGKIDATSASGLGTCIAVETAGRYTYYVIEVA